MDNKTEIKQFVKTITEKNYKEANVALQKIVDAKIKSRVSATLAEKNN